MTFNGSLFIRMSEQMDFISINLSIHTFINIFHLQCRGFRKTKQVRRLRFEKMNKWFHTMNPQKNSSSLILNTTTYRILKPSPSYGLVISFVLTNLHFVFCHSAVFESLFDQK